VRVDVSDPIAYQAYLGLAPQCIKKFGGRFLARGGRHEVPEGVTRARNTIVEFPSYDAAVQCYHSADYQAAREKRAEVASMDLVIIEGLDADQLG
jgi:uncharacterized protein (DUF1330 family)